MPSPTAARTLAPLATLGCLLGGCTQPTNTTFVFTDPGGRSYDALIEPANPASRTGYSIMFIGGGSVTDMDWTVPATVPDGSGCVMQLTIDGEPTRDARTIALALTNAGFDVLRYSSIHKDDELARTTPGMAMGIKYEPSVEIARAAKAAFAERGGFEPGRLILLGHSLGATRAAHIADDDVAGFVCLAGAYLSWTRAGPTEVSRAAIARVNAGPEGLDATGVLPEGVTPEADIDGDGRIRGWELASFTGKDGFDPEERGGPFRDPLPWAPDVLLTHGAPVLTVCGGLDPISIHGPHIEALAREEGLDGKVVYLAGLGHQLSVERGALVGPIDPEAVDIVRAWLVARFGEDSPGG